MHYYLYYSNRSRGARRLIENGDDITGSIRIDEPPANTRIIALIDDVDVVERILRHLDQWDPQPDTSHPQVPIRRCHKARPCP